MQRQILLIALACAAAAAHAADVYKWTDQEGIVHYSDTEPPPQVKSERIHMLGTAKKGAEAAANDADEAATPPAKAKAEPETLLAGTPEFTQKRCERARADLEVLQGSGPVGLNTGGKPEVLDEAGRKAQTERAQSTIATYCK